MILKHADDRQVDIDILESLKSHPGADSIAKTRLSDEIRNIRAGRAGESVAAYAMNFDLGKTANWIVIHDLRIEHEGLTAQIDHLVIDRVLNFYICESKSFANGVSINEMGEFTTFYDRRPHGVASPIEQNRRHIRVLESLAKSGALNLPKRLGLTIKPKMISFVLVSKGSIQRPTRKFPGLETVIKSDQLTTTLMARSDQENPFMMARVIGVETLADIGRQLVDLHRPKPFDWAAKFGLRPAPATREPISPPVTPPQNHPPEASIAEPVAVTPLARKTASAVSCITCGDSVSRGVASYCRSNSERFNAAIYCMPCQGQLPR
jgi:hypothetical protein